jgi:hypothetical protein
MTKKCCKCQRVEHNGVWEARWIAAERRAVTHGYCPDCYAVAMAEIENYILARGASGRDGRRPSGAQGLHHPCG